jgi:hypothetical protein
VIRRWLGLGVTAHENPALAGTHHRCSRRLLHPSLARGARRAIAGERIDLDGDSPIGGRFRLTGTGGGGRDGLGASHLTSPASSFI